MEGRSRRHDEILALSDEMIRLADRGEAEAEDGSCAILYGILRDSAYTLKKLLRKDGDASEARPGW